MNKIYYGDKLEYIKIGKVKIEKTASLAPMASVADKAYRIIVKKAGAAMVTGEMASSKGLVFSDRKTKKLLEVSDEERPMAIQLFGDDPQYISFAVKTAEKFNPNFIDINAGCPVPKVAGNGSGSALMKTPKLLGEIVKSAVLSTKIPITVKIRKGWDDNNINAVEIAKIVEENGASAIAIHGRTRMQMYSGNADWDIIAKVKQSVSIPVIANGDVDSVESCVKMYDYTGCDLVMIGRGSYGNPWLFRDIRRYFNGEKALPEPSLFERLEMMKNHVALLVAEKGELIGMREARRQAAYYLKGIKSAAKFRNMCSSLTVFADFEELVKQILAENKGDIYELVK